MAKRGTRNGGSKASGLHYGVAETILIGRVSSKDAVASLPIGTDDMVVIVKDAYLHAGTPTKKDASDARVLAQTRGMFTWGQDGDSWTWHVDPATGTRRKVAVKCMVLLSKPVEDKPAKDDKPKADTSRMSAIGSF